MVDQHANKRAWLIMLRQLPVDDDQGEKRATNRDGAVTGGWSGRRSGARTADGTCGTPRSAN